MDATALRLDHVPWPSPRVARAARPWASRLNPFGIPASPRPLRRCCAARRPYHGKHGPVLGLKDHAPLALRLTDQVPLTILHQVTIPNHDLTYGRPPFIARLTSFN